jgi:hypothetical protein
MNDNFKKGFVITLGVIVAIVVVGWLMKMV